MFGRSTGLEKAAQALATAGAIAHAAFFTLFIYRVFGTSWLYLVLAVLALVGLGANFVGFMLIKHGGRVGARKWGMWCIAFSTADAALLLTLASILGS
ncbi:MAG: hypothetical protein IPF92_00515 [Myxococcales bacterium]|jgi:hypothetical protein|nr:hypothetical protein [Myxococcales bacterium]MBL0193614.1 hypothetical protein [Myxococcales bacterium]HQY64626.1 hypothetical protein [Polyangiaceae bacterium]HRG96912.1 hypothetical protein [Polyangiaceae bacterium]